MFDLGQLLGPLIFNPYRFKDLWHLLEDQDALSVHYKKWRRMSYDGNGDKLEQSLDDSLVQGLKSDINEARKHYANMMLVNAATYLEAILYSFFNAVFERKPLALNAYLRGDSREATISLRKLLTQSKEDILSQMISAASKEANNGDISSIFRRVKKLSGYEIPQDIESRAISLNETRNGIVHEAMQLDIGCEEVLEAFDTVQSVLRHLGFAAIKSGVSVSDPAHLLD